MATWEASERRATVLGAALTRSASSPAVLLGAILLLALLLRVPPLTRSIWLDELWSIRLILNGDDPVELLLRDVHPPLYSLLMFAWVGLVGSSEVVIRLPSLILG